ncbi:DegT/DnrJ/EryC1/StrS family aminotransferase, partial [Vibrio cholerae]
YCGVKYCISLANGTDALEIGLKVLLGEDNCLNNEIEVITVANAGGYSTTACRLLGVKPVYADIDRNTHLIDPQSIIRCLSDKTKVVITTHLYGGIVDVQKIRALLDENGYRHVKILEDCAQAHGGRLNNKRVGAFGDLAAFSFYPTKNLGAMGDAGALVTSNENLYNIASKLKQYGWSKKYEIALKFARNSRMDEIQAAVLNAILPHLDDLNQKRIKIYRRYVEAIRSENIHFLDYSNCDYVAHLAIVIVNEREDFIRFMSDRNISVDIHYPILDIEQPAWVGEDFRMDNTTELNNTKLATGSIVSLPLFPLMNEDEIEAVISAIKVWGRKI